MPVFTKGPYFLSDRLTCIGGYLYVFGFQQLLSIHCIHIYTLRHHLNLWAQISGKTA